MKNKKLEAILNTIKLRDEKGKIYPISDELMLQYIINFLTQKPLNSIIVDRDRLYSRYNMIEKISELGIYVYYIRTIFEFYLNSPRRIKLYDSVDENEKADIDYFMNKEINNISCNTKGAIWYKEINNISCNTKEAIWYLTKYFLGDSYFSDLEQVITDKGILNSLTYHAFEVEYGKDIAYLEFVPSEFDAKIKEKRKSLVNPEEMNELIKTIIEKGKTVAVPPEG